MGACNCIELREGENQDQITTSKGGVMHFKNSSNDEHNEEFAETTETLGGARYARGNFRPQEKEYDLESVKVGANEENTPKPQDTDPNFQNGRVDTVIEKSKAPVEKSPSNIFETSSNLKGNDRVDTILVVGDLPENNESDYNEVNNELFRIFNDMRSNPEKYESTLDSRLRNTLRRISEERVDTILNSVRFYEIAFDYMISLNDKNIPTSQIHNFLQNEINSYARDDEKYEVLLLSYTGQHDDSTAYSILSENLTEAKRALSEKFSYGFVCAVPTVDNQSRTVLCLLQRL